MIKALTGRLHGSGSAISYIMTISLLLVLPGIVQPAILKIFVDDVLVRGFTDWLLPMIIGLLLSGLLSALLTWLQQRYLLVVQTKLAVTMAAQFFWHVLCVPTVFFSQRYVGDVASRVQSCHTLASLLSGPLPTTVIHCIMIVFFGGVMLIFSWQLTLLVLVMTAGNVIALKLAQRRRKDLNNVLLNEQAKSQGAAMAGLQAIETLKASGTEADFFGIWSGYQTKTVNTNQQLSTVTTGLNAVPGLLDSLLTALVLGGGALLIMNGQLTIGGLIAFQALMGHVTGPIKGLIGFGAQLQEIEGDLNRLDDVLRYPRDPLLVADKREMTALKLSGHVELKNVTFGYSPLDAPLIENFNLSLTPGKRVALVGGSGSGKSTMSKLILGVYQPRAGEVLYDGRPLATIPRGLCGALDQLGRPGHHPVRGHDRARISRCGTRPCRARSWCGRRAMHRSTTPSPNGRAATTARWRRSAPISAAASASASKSPVPWSTNPPFWCSTRRLRHSIR